MLKLFVLTYAYNTWSTGSHFQIYIQLLTFLLIFLDFQLVKKPFDFEIADLDVEPDMFSLFKSSWSYTSSLSLIVSIVKCLCSYTCIVNSSSTRQKIFRAS